MPGNSATVPAVVPRTAPSSVVTIGAPPDREPEAAALVPAVAAVAPAAARVSAASAAQQTAASRARRQWVVFMILTLSISPEREGKAGEQLGDALSRVVMHPVRGGLEALDAVQAGRSGRPTTSIWSSAGSGTPRGVLLKTAVALPRRRSGRPWRPH